MSLIHLQKNIGIKTDGIFGPITLRKVTEYFNFTPVRSAHFFGQVSHESANFKLFSENLNYSPRGLMSIFKKYFPTLEEAQQYAYKPEKIANKVYANRMGNGPESSGDGWKYRGRGALQLTGFNNYSLFSKSLNRPDILTNPDIVATELAFESAIWFFDINKLWRICDQGINSNSILSLTRRINGGTNGLKDREEKTLRYFSWF